MAMAQILAFPATAPKPPIVPPAPRDPAREMVAAAVKSWMEGDPLTAREQRIVDAVIDANYFGQLGRLAFGG